MTPDSDTSGPEPVLEHLAWVRRLALALVRDRNVADDLIQETWLAALRNPPPPDRPQRAWLARVLRNAARQRGRRERTRTEHEARAARSEALPSDAELIERVELQRRLVEHVMELEPVYRRTLLLRYFEGLAAPEIARREGVPQATVRTRLRRGLDQLRERLDREGGSDGSTWRLALAPLLPRGSAVQLARTGALVVSTKALYTGGAVLAATLLYATFHFVAGKMIPPPPAAPTVEADASVLAGAQAVDSTPATAPEPSSGGRSEVEDPAPLETVRVLTVLGAEDSIPLVGADVWLLEHAAFLEWRKDHGWGGRSDVTPALEARGERRTADGDGQVRLPFSGGTLWVMARSGQHFGKRRYVESDELEVELLCHVDPPLEVLVVDTAGHPLVGAPVGLIERHVDEVLLKETMTGPDGVARLHLRDETVRTDAHYMVALEVPLPEPVEAAVDPLAPNREQVRLVAPFMGRVRLRLVDEDGEPFPLQTQASLQVVLPSRTKPGGSELGPRDHRWISGVSEILFEHVAVGIDVYVYIWGPGDLDDVQFTRSSPTQAGEELLFEVPMTVRLASIRGRLVDETGAAPTRVREIDGRVLARTEDRERRVGRELQVKPDGAFTFVLWEQAPAGTRCRVEVWSERVEPILSANFEVVMPGPGGRVDVGTVVLRPAPLVVAGRVVDGEGRTLDRVWLSLGDKLHQPSGTFDWNFMGVATQYADAQGRFEVHAPLELGEYALHAGKRSYTKRWTPFRFGQTDLEVVLLSLGGLRGSLLLPPGFPAERLVVTARPASDDPPAWSRAGRDRNSAVAQDGRFEIEGLAPGLYEVALRTGHYSEPLRVLGEADVQGDGTAEPDALQRVDLRELRAIDLEVTTITGAPASGVAIVRSPSTEPRVYRLHEGRLSLLTARPSLDVELVANGCRPERIEDLGESRRVVLDAGIPVTIRLPAGFRVPDPPLILRAVLIPQDAARLEHGYVYIEDDQDRQRLRQRDLHANLPFDGNRDMVLGAPAPGRYRLRWWLIDFGEPGVGGGSSQGILSSSGTEVLEVVEGGKTIEARPRQEDFERALEFARRADG